VQRVLAEAGGVEGIGKQVIVIAYGKDTQTEEGVAFGESIQVEQDFFRRIFCVEAAAMDGVLLAFFGAREIEIAAETVGDGEIGLQDAAEHFLVKLFLKRFGGAENGVGVGVFGVEVGEDFGILFFAKPGVGIDAAVAVEDVLDGMEAGERGLRGVGRGCLG